MKILKSIACAALLTTFGATASNAAIVTGQVTGGQSLSQGGVFVELTAPFTQSSPNSTVGRNTFQDPNLYAFNEGVFTVSADLALEFGSLTAGQRIESHLIAYDPRRSTTMTGYVDFDGEIIGVASSLSSLVATSIYENASVNYRYPRLVGLERRDSFALSGLQRILLDFRASSPGDYVRVFTASEIPLPAAAWLFLAGIAGLIAKTRRKVKA